MRLVNTSEAASLTGLSREQLREWSSRRALVPADIQHRGRGAAAQYAWQTVLLLRVAGSLKQRFHIELHANRGLLASMRVALGRISFLRLWGHAIAIYDASNWELLDVSGAHVPETDAVIVQLDPHLAVLAAAFAMPNPASAGQLELFPARLVRNVGVDSGGANDSANIQSARRRRRA